MKIAVLDDYQGVAAALADWGSLGAEVTFFRDSASGRTLVDRLRPFEVVCLMRERTPFQASLIEALPALRLIVTTGARNASIDVAAAKARGIAVSGTESRGPSTAQLAMALILAGTRGFVREVNAMRDGGWQQGVGRDLDGLVLGLVGLDRIGAQVAALARLFGMETAAWSANLADARCAEIHAYPVPIPACDAQFNHLLARRDAIEAQLAGAASSSG